MASERHYRGVWKRPWRRYAAEIRDPWKKTRVWLGTFDTPEEVAAAYDGAARSLHGLNAKRNFPMTSLLPPSLTMDVDNISSGRWVQWGAAPPGMQVSGGRWWSSMVVANSGGSGGLPVAEGSEVKNVGCYGIVRRGLGIDLNEPPPLWL